MDKLVQKYEQLQQALKTLGDSNYTFELFVKEKISYNPNLSYQDEYKVYRDSVIQRFEYSIDLFWKYIKKYLENANALSGTKLPVGIIRAACELEIITQDEAESILCMIKDRNLTSYIYVEEIAEQLVSQIPRYHKILSNVLTKIPAKK